MVMGTECAIYASCLNNVALMHKLVRSLFKTEKQDKFLFMIVLVDGGEDDS